MGRSAELPAGTIGQYWGYTSPQTRARPRRALVRRAGRQGDHVAGRRRLPRHEVRRGDRRSAWTGRGPDRRRRSRTTGTRPRSLPGVGEEQLLGVEAPLWTETLATIDDVEYMAFPRLAGDRRDRLVARGTARLAEFATALPAFGALPRRARDHATSASRESTGAGDAPSDGRPRAACPSRA